MDRLVRGDRAAFLEVSRLITGFLVQWRAYDFRDEWDDLIQEVVLAAIEATRAQRLRKPGAIVGYLRTATRYKFVDCLRRRRGEPLEQEGEERPADLRWPPTPQSDPGSFEIWDQVDKLPENQRKSIVSVYVRGNTYNEAAAATGIPLGSLKRHLREGLATLRAELADFREKRDPVPPPIRRIRQGAIAELQTPPGGGETAHELREGPGNRPGGLSRGPAICPSGPSSASTIRPVPTVRKRSPPGAASRRRCARPVIRSRRRIPPWSSSPVSRTTPALSAPPNGSGWTSTRANAASVPTSWPRCGNSTSRPWRRVAGDDRRGGARHGPVRSRAAAKSGQVGRARTSDEAVGDLFGAQEPDLVFQSREARISGTGHRRRQRPSPCWWRSRVRWPAASSPSPPARAGSAAPRTARSGFRASRSRAWRRASAPSPTHSRSRRSTSASRVRVNGEPVRSGPLRDGDLLQIGGERFQIRSVTSK